MPEKSIEQLFREKSYNLNDSVDKSSTWFMSQVQDIFKEYGASVASPGKILTARQGSGSTGLTSNLSPGNFYMYVYDPKHKKTLPYYDVFPLTIPFSAEQDRFTGLNFHYLPYKARIRLLTHLMKYATTKSILSGNPTVNEKTKMNFNWGLVKNSAAHPLVAPAIHTYLNKHVRTKFKLIEPQHWAAMMMLPAEKFMKENKSQVWRDTAKTAVTIAKRKG